MMTASYYTSHWLMVVALSTGYVLCAQDRSCGFVIAPQKENSSGRVSDDGRRLYIPVVFHIVYRNPDENVSDEQIYSQLEVINEDFSRQNSDAVNTLPQFTSVAASANIQFYIAERNGESGITRTSTSHIPFHNDDLHQTQLGGKDAWDTNKYLNVWVAALAPDIFGYGASPGSPPFRDGVAVDFRYFGRNGKAIAPFNLGRTLTHEVGHWLGLQHLWGAGGCDSDDGLVDTPKQSAVTAGCVLSQTSCGGLNMVQNFMNTSDDACMNLFTKQQVEVMRNTLFNQRSLAYHENLVVTATESAEPTWKIFPNPVTQSTAMISLGSNKVQHVSLIDIRGKVVRDFGTIKDKTEMQIDLNEVDNGMYLLRITHGDGVSCLKLNVNTK